MFDMGFAELALIFIIGLVILGPERLPKAARTVGLWIGRARGTFNNLRNELEREVLDQDVKARLEKQMREMGLDEESIRKAKESLLTPDEIARARQPLNPDKDSAPSPDKPSSTPPPNANE